MEAKELKAQGNVLYLVENSSVNNAEKKFGAIIKIGKKSYSVSFTSCYWWEGDDFTFSPKNIQFLEAGVNPTKNRIHSVGCAIRAYKGNIKDFQL